MDDIKPALDKAAVSPDPAVRNMALFYTEARKKLGALEAFFAFYAEGASLTGKSYTTGTTPGGAPTPSVPAKAKNTVAGSSSGGEKSSVKYEDFTTTILSILYESDKPVPLASLQLAYEALNKEPPMQSETFRQRMINRQKKKLVVLIPRVGYWPPEPKSDA